VDKPKVHPQTAALHERNLTIFIHSPYQINVASRTTGCASRPAPP